MKYFEVEQKKGRGGSLFQLFMLIFKSEGRSSMGWLDTTTNIFLSVPYNGMSHVATCIESIEVVSFTSLFYVKGRDKKT